MMTNYVCECGASKVLELGSLHCTDPSCTESIPLPAVYDVAENIRLPEVPAGVNVWDVEESLNGTNGQSSLPKKKKRRGKYNARKIPYDGYTFDSIAESVRWWELKPYVEKGLIWEAKLQKPYVLQDKSRDWRDKAIRAIKYKPDFVYFTTRAHEWNDRKRLEGYSKPSPAEESDVVLVAEDVKGVRPTAYAMVAKMFMVRYPDIHFYEVASKKVWNGRRNTLPVEIRLIVEELDRQEQQNGH